MKTFKVYLAGAISGQSYIGATDWRKYATTKLAEGQFTYSIGDTGVYKNGNKHTGIYAYSPMRASGYLHDMEGMPEDRKQTNIKRILQRDHWDCKTADVIFCNLLNVSKVSIGTVMEIAWAYSYGIPIVIVMDEENLHRHGMIVESTGWITTDLDEGIQMVKDILLP